MSFDTFMDVDGIVGESLAKGFEKKIDIFSFSWGAHSPVSVGSGTGGMSASKVSISSFNVMKKTDAASPLLFEACCTGQHINSILITMRKQGGTASGQLPFLTYKFDGVMVESVQWSGSTGGDDTPTESVSLAFAKVTVEYKMQDMKGAIVKGPKPVVWDLTKVTNA